MIRRNFIQGLGLMPFGNQRIGFNNPLQALGFNPVFNKKGLFVYNTNPPTLGSLVFSITNGNGTDKYGNTYFGPGAYSYDPVGGNNGGLAGAALHLQAATEFQAFQVSEDLPGGTLFQTGKKTNLDTVLVMQFLSALAAGSPKGTLVIGAGANNTQRLLELAGDMVTSLVSAWHPGSLTVQETWQSMNTRGYQNGWTDSGNNPPGSWQYLPLGPVGEVQNRGSLFTPLNPPDGQVVLNYPAIYHPASAHPNFTGRCIVPSNAAAQVRFNMLANGNLTVAGASALAANTEIIIPESAMFGLD